MKLLYSKKIPVMILIMSLTGIACGQNTKIKTITIVNGDTTISEKEIGVSDMEDIEKHITMVIDEDGNGDRSGKKVIKKKIIINDGEHSENNALAYSYSYGDNKNEDVEITTDEKGNETKIIIKKKGDKKSGSGERKHEIHKSMSSAHDEKEKFSININVKNTIAKVDIETSDKGPINISVLDENGKQVFYDTQKEGGKYSKEINLEKKGTYFMNIIRNKKSTTEKIEIK
jgi:hypothetical protein